MSKITNVGVPGLKRWVPSVLLFLSVVYWLLRCTHCVPLLDRSDKWVFFPHPHCTNYIFYIRPNCIYIAIRYPKWSSRSSPTNNLTKSLLIVKSFLIFVKPFLARLGDHNPGANLVMFIGGGWPDKNMNPLIKHF